MQPPQIDYAPQLPSHKRRRTMRRAVFGIIAMVAAFFAVESASPAWHRILILYWQHEAMTYSPPADRVVYDDDPAQAPKLRAGNPKLLSGSSGETVDFAKPWEQLDALLSAPGAPPTATLFLHARRNATGQERLVVVSATKMASWQLLLGPQTVPSTSQRRVIIGALVCAPGAAFSNPTTIDNGNGPVGTPLPILEGSRIRFYAGQADPRNESHFTIRATIDGNTVTLDGWLLADDRIEIY